jgi:hypothetical protein
MEPLEPIEPACPPGRCVKPAGKLIKPYKLFKPMKVLLEEQIYKQEFIITMLP